MALRRIGSRGHEIVTECLQVDQPGESTQEIDFTYPSGCLPALMMMGEARMLTVHQDGTQLVTVNCQENVCSVPFHPDGRHIVGDC